MGDQDLHYFLLIGTYRDNEVSTSSPLMITLVEMKQTQAEINTIQVSNLSPEHVKELIADALHHPEGIQDLAELVYKKTHGNAFFVHQLLHSLDEKQILEFNFATQRWRWDLSAIQQVDITDNVVDLMVARVRRLPEATQALLTLGACIGNHFDLETLAVISEKTLQEMVHALQFALTEGLLFSTGSSSLLATSDEALSSLTYGFSHDRIQEAVYALIADAEKPAIHLKIGALLCEKLPQKQKNERTFEIMNHLNAGRHLLDDPDDFLKLATANLQAGKKAKMVTAYHTALRHFTIGTELLSEKHWDTDHALIFELYRERYECEYLNSHFEQAETLFPFILKHAVSKLEKAEIYNICIVYYTMLAKYPEAIETGREALKLFGLELPEHDVERAIERDVADTFTNLGDRRIADLIQSPMISKRTHQEIIKLLTNLISPTYLSNPLLNRFVIVRAVNLALQYGNTQEIPYGYAVYGAFLGSGGLGKYQTGHEFGKLAIRLSERLQNSTQQCRMYYTFAAFTNHWRMPVTSNLSFVRQAFQYGLESGELQFAGYTFAALLVALISQGTELDEVLQEVKRGIHFSNQTKNGPVFVLCTIWQQFTLNLQGCTRAKQTFDDPNFQEVEFLKNPTANPFVLCLYQIYKLQSLYLYEEYAEALRRATDSENMLAYIPGMLVEAEQNFYYSLTLSALYSTADDEERRHYQEKLKSNQQQMKLWAENCPENFRHKYPLVEAEIARIEGRNWDAIEHYRRAIEETRTYEFLQNEALGKELLAKFWLAQGDENIAKVYLTDARYTYQLWGAHGKVKDLEEHYPHLIISSNTERNSVNIVLHDTDSPTSSEGLPEEVLDLVTLMKASQAISGEIVLDALLSKIMNIVIENAGAQRGLLLLPHNEHWFIEAENDVTWQEPIVLQSLPLEGDLQNYEHLKLPLTIVNYVFRTHEPLVLNNALAEGDFAEDGYINQYQPKSVLCLPLLYRGSLEGMLYLENNLTTGAFTSERLEVLQLLASQAAISIENARLYTTLEQKVQERTCKLEQEITERKRTEETAEAANQAKSEFLASMSHELRSPLNAILGYTQILHRDAKLDERQSKAVDVIQRSGEHLLMVISDVLDLSKIEARKLEISLADFHLRRCLKSVADIARMRAHQQGISFNMEFDDTLPLYVHGDEKCLRQVLLNLLNNAVKFTEKGEVTFRVSKLETRNLKLESKDRNLDNSELQFPVSSFQFHHTIRFEIQDTGIGIAAEHLEQIFLPFYQIKNPSIQHNGTGLGLAISQKLVYLMKGELQVTSTPGQGTRFWFDLEFANATIQEDVSPISQNIIGYKGRIRTILIADDQEENRDILKEILLPLGFEIIEAEDGNDALSKLETYSPDLMLIDLMMSKLNGFETIRRIRHTPEYSQIPIISVSANVLDHIQRESMRAGSHAFLAKPIQIESLLEKLQQYLPIEWVYEKPTEEEIMKSPRIDSQSLSVQAIQPPSQEALEVLFQWAMRGDVHRLKEQAQELEHSDPSLRAFGKQLYHMATAYQIDEIQEFLAHYMEEQS